MSTSILSQERNEVDRMNTQQKTVQNRKLQKEQS